MRLSIIIPVYNKQKTILEIISRVREVDLGEISKEIIVIDDCSTDDTWKLLFGREEEIKLIRQDKNQGKGAAIIQGFKISSGDIVLIQDADLEYDPSEYLKLLKPILQKKADVVYGSRFISGDSHRVMYFWHFVGNKLLTCFSNMLTNLNLTDMETCYKVFTRTVVNDIKDKLKSKRFGIEPEVTSRIKKYRVYEVGISYSGRTYEEGKKISWRDGFVAIWSIFRFNLF